MLLFRNVCDLCVSTECDVENLAIQKEDVMESKNTADFQKFAAQKIYL